MESGRVNHGGGAFAKVVQKTLVRTKTKVKQKLGKARKTTDGTFDEHVADFHRQQAAAMRLSKEVKHYVNCVRAMTIASKNLRETLNSTFEEEWVDMHTVDRAIKSLEMLHDNYEAELSEQVETDLNTYVQQFGPIKEKINKRGRKLLDYDNAKHQCETLNSAKKLDQIRTAKAEESLAEARKLYDDMNTELHRELPKFYDYRIDFLASNLGRLFSAETTFHCETGKVMDQLQAIMEAVPREEKRVKSRPHSIATSNHENGAHGPTAEDEETHTPIDLSVSGSAAEHKTNGYPEESDPVSQTPDSPSYKPKHLSDSPEYEPIDVSCTAHYTVHSSDSPEHASPTDQNNCDRSVTPKGANPQQDSLPDTAEQTGAPVTAALSSDSSQGDTILLASSEPQPENDTPITTTEESKEPDHEDENLYQNVEDPKPGQLQVMATHAYRAEDEDELNFEAGEIINVIDFDDPEDQDEGWLMGISTVTGHRGVFPENFTRKIIRRKAS